METSSIAAIAILIAGLAGAGFATGFLAGLLGVGGGAFLVPVLYELFSHYGVDESVRMHMVLGTSLAVIVPTSLRSFSGHYAKGAVDMDIWRRMAPWVAAGVVLGVLTAKLSSTAGLKWIWIVAGTVIATKFAIGREDWRLGEQLPKSKGVEATALIIGLVSALMSIGGGMFIVSLLTLYGLPIHRAVATSAGFGPVIAVPGTLGYMLAGWGVPLRPPYSIGYVNIPAALLIMPTSMYAVPLGVKAAHALSKRKLEIAFAVFLFCVVARFLYSLFK
ncbi:MAG: sulfite exporter TauE/SafE family protein [Hyphomicrobiaceae bacterium]|nr:sulfite exporter TauE/SafE family protein [Hyphomicrobiaceae bacterium]